MTLITPDGAGDAGRYNPDRGNEAEFVTLMKQRLRESGLRVDEDCYTGEAGKWVEFRVYVPESGKEGTHSLFIGDGSASNQTDSILKIAEGDEFLNLCEVRIYIGHYDANWHAFQVSPIDLAICEKKFFNRISLLSVRFPRRLFCPEALTSELSAVQLAAATDDTDNRGYVFPDVSFPCLAGPLEPIKFSVASRFLSRQPCLVDLSCEGFNATPIENASHWLSTFLVGAGLKFVDINEPDLECRISSDPYAEYALIKEISKLLVSAAPQSSPTENGLGKQGVLAHLEFGSGPASITVTGVPTKDAQRVNFKIESAHQDVVRELEAWGRPYAMAVASGLGSSLEIQIESLEVEGMPPGIFPCSAAQVALLLALGNLVALRGQGNAFDPKIVFYARNWKVLQ